MSEAADPGPLVPPTHLDAAPTKKLVIIALRERGALTYRELQRHTGQGSRAVEQAVRAPRAEGVIESDYAPRADDRPGTKVHALSQL
jgi:predicted DNA-binding ArsR family transcriptional regulator